MLCAHMCRISLTWVCCAEKQLSIPAEALPLSYPYPYLYLLCVWERAKVVDVKILQNSTSLIWLVFFDVKLACLAETFFFALFLCGLDWMRLSLAISLSLSLYLFCWWCQLPSNGDAYPSYSESHVRSNLCQSDWSKKEKDRASRWRER